jgi:hypothetical protein
MRTKGSRSGPSRSLRTVLSMRTYHRIKSAVGQWDRLTGFQNERTAPGGRAHGSQRGLKMHLVTSSTSAATTHTDRAQALRDHHHGRAVVVEVEGPSDGSSIGVGAGGWGGGGLPQLVGRQAEKVRQCRMVLVSLPCRRQHSPTPV